MSCFFPHLINSWHYNAEDGNKLKRWMNIARHNGIQPMVKFENSSAKGVPGHIDDMDKDVILVIRDYDLSENWGDRVLNDAADAKLTAKMHADRSVEIYNAINKEYGPRRMVFEGLNEPRLEAGEPPELIAIYEMWRMRFLHQYDIPCVIYNFSVGWPNNTGKDTPSNWKPFAPAFTEFRVGDYLAVHEYGGNNGMQNWTPWWLERFSMCPYDVPILITECGIDTGVQGLPLQGWWTQPYNTLDDKAWNYVQQLRWYETTFDRRIKGAFIFTYDWDNEAWQTFDIRTDVFMNLFFPYLEDGTIKYSTKEPAMTNTKPEEVPTEVWGDANTTPWKALCEKYGLEYNVDARVLATQIKIESNGVSSLICQSVWGEVGLGQIIPCDTKGPHPEWFTNRPTTIELLKPDVNIKWCALILRYYLTRMNNDLHKGLMSYNAGDGWVNANPDAKDTSVNYVAKFVNAWIKLWGKDSLPDGLSANAETTPSTEWETQYVLPELEKPIWFTEESVRKIKNDINIITNEIATSDTLILSEQERKKNLEGAKTELEGAVQSLLNDVVNKLYQIR